MIANRGEVCIGIKPLKDKLWDSLKSQPTADNKNNGKITRKLLTIRKSMATGNSLPVSKSLATIAADQQIAEYQEITEGDQTTAQS